MLKSIHRLIDRYWAWLLAGLFGVTLAGVVIVRVAGPLGYEPALVEALAPQTITTKQAINLNDLRRIEQTFSVKGKVMSHVGVRIANLRAANPDSVITVSLHSKTGSELGRAQGRLGDFRHDDITLLPIRATLNQGHNYVISVSSNGIPQGRDVSVFREQADEKVANAEIRIVNKHDTTEEVSAASGNIRFQILARPSLGLIAQWIWYLPAWWIVLGYFAVLGSLFVVREKLKRYIPLGAPSIHRQRLSIRELIVALAMAVSLAVTITLPYFTGLDHITTMGDVQRALIYRGVARHALLSHGDIATWDPYLCGGEPLLANMESAHTDPFFLLAVIFGENLGTRLSVTATLIIGFLGAYFLARRYGQAAKIPALLAGAIFSFSGFQMLAFANGNFAWIPIGWIPWFVIFYLEALGGKWQRHVFLSGLMIAFIFLGGSLHMTMYAVLGVGFLALFLSLFHKSLWPLLVLLLIGMMFTSLIAVKLLPVAEIEAVSGEFLRPKPFIQPWSWLPQMFWDRDQLSTPQWVFKETGENYRWIEYGSYVGIVPIVFALLGLVRMRRQKMLIAIAGGALFLLLMTFNEFPATVLRELPFLQGVFRNPQRARGVLMLFFGVLAAYGLSKSIRNVWVQVLIVGVLLLDFATFHSALYPKLFNLDRPPIEKSETFIRLHESYTDEEDNGYYKVSYENYRAHMGVVDICMPYMMQRGVHARGFGTSNSEKTYFGEAMLTEEGSIQAVVVDGDITRVSFDAKKDGWLVLNQNYFPGWKTNPPRDTKKYKGLVAARIRPGDKEITFIYDPPAYQLGSLLTLGAVILGLSSRSGQRQGNKKGKITEEAIDEPALTPI